MIDSKNENHSLVSVNALSPRTRMIQNEKDAFFAQYAHNTDNTVLEIIWQAKETRATRLDLGNCGLTELPDALFELTWLEELYIGTESLCLHNNEEATFTSDNTGKPNNIGYFQPEISALTELKVLVGNDGFKQQLDGKDEWGFNDLSPLQSLTNLEVLSMSRTKISDLSPLKSLTNLKFLTLANPNISDISVLANFTKLESLYLHATNIDDLAPLKELTSLQQLHVGWTNVNDLMPIENLKKLKSLYITTTKVADLQPISDFTDLRLLHISHTLIDNLEPLKKLEKLEHLEINILKLKSIETLKYLPNLNVIRALESQISDLTPLKELKNLTLLDVRSNPIAYIPREIYDQMNCAQDLYAYWKEIESKETIINNQTKLIFVGNSRAGKTSLWQFLKDKVYNEQADSTHGIKTEIWDTETLGTEDNQNLAAHIWDFGGQEYYHATHRLFLSDNAVYVLVWEENSNKQGTSLEKFKLDDDPQGEIEEVLLEHFPASYWLDNIRYFGGQSPVLIVQNKVDEEAQKANYTEGVQNINDCFHLSVKNAFSFQKGNQAFKRSDLKFQDFKERLLEILRHNATKFDKVAKYWTEVRDELVTLGEQRAKNKEAEYISFEELEKIAFEKDVTKTPDMQNILLYLKSFTNTILYFPKNEVLKDRLYLNPTHISRDIYKILNKDVREKNGVFNLDHIMYRLNCDASDALRYSELMKQFDLIFDKKRDDGMSRFITPQYLKPKNELGINIDVISRQLKLTDTFFIRFSPFVPRSMMSRFIASNGQYTIEETYWKNGLIYESPKTALPIKVEYDHDNYTFCIAVQNKEQQFIDRQNIVAQFETLNGGDDTIQLSNDGKNYVELKTLRRLQHENKRGEIHTDKGATISLNDYEWLIKKQKESMKQTLIDLLKQGKLEEVFAIINKIADSQNSYFNDPLILLQSRFNRNENDKRDGMESSGDYKIERNRIESAVKSLINGEFDERKVPPTFKLETKEATETPRVVTSAKPKIYFSYAWGDEEETGESRDKIVHELYESLKADNYDVRRDKEEIEYKDMISDFMKEIGRGDCIVIAISDKYLKSSNCMFEMYEIFRNSKLDRGAFKEKIFPIRVESIRLSDPSVLDTYFEHWEQEEKKWEALIVKRGTRISPAQQERYRRIKAIASELGDFLDFLSDINTKTRAELSKDNFEEIKQAIAKRAS